MRTMRTMRKLSSLGDTKLAEYDVNTDPKLLEKYERDFNDWKARGGLAADVTDKRNVLIDKFDANADIVLIPRIQGGSR